MWKGIVKMVTIYLIMDGDYTVAVFNNKIEAEKFCEEANKKELCIRYEVDEDKIYNKAEDLLKDMDEEEKDCKDIINGEDNENIPG